MLLQVKMTISSLLGCVSHTTQHQAGAHRQHQAVFAVGNTYHLSEHTAGYLTMLLQVKVKACSLLGRLPTYLRKTDEELKEGIRPSSLYVTLRLGAHGEDLGLPCRTRYAEAGLEECLWDSWLHHTVKVCHVKLPLTASQYQAEAGVLLGMLRGLRHTYIGTPLLTRATPSA